MSVSLSSYLPRIRRMLRDTGEIEHEEFLGDSSAEEFYLTAAPIKADSVSIYLDDVLEVDWTLDYDTGQLVFDVAPGSNIVIKTLYISYEDSDTTLVEYLSKAIADSMDYLEDSFTVSGDSPDTVVDTEPANNILRLWMLLLQRQFLIDKVIDSAKVSVSWSANDMAMNRTNIVTSTLKILDKLEEQIEKQAWRINYNDITGVVVAGGETPGTGFTVGDSYVVEWKDYPRGS